MKFPEVDIFLRNYLQKQTPVAFCKKRCSQKFHKLHRKTTAVESLFNEVPGLQQETLQQICFPVKFAKLLRAPILKNICEQLLLYLVKDVEQSFMKQFSCEQKKNIKYNL